ncbi:SPOC like C-terminal domain-containing protein [Lipomyces oligophaga]|uniref:SPOC like C-terminal domain-containing protein n=1 Tax=Lipomyces oligophaga TaxID=45792 RepID=UPI0034CE001C
MSEGTGNQADDFDVDLLEEDYKNQKDALLFCIEVSPPMLEIVEAPSADLNDKPIQTCALRIGLRAAYSVLQQRIIATPSDALGILLFGTQETTDQTYENCLILVGLDVPNVRGIRRIRDLLEDDNEFEKVCKPCETMPPISTMLFCANQQFVSLKGTGYRFRRLFLLTNTDLPPANSPKDRIVARTRANDLFELGIQIEPFFLCSPARSFDATKFYEDILYPRPTTTALDSDSIPLRINMQPISTTESLIFESNMKARQVPRHAIFSIPMEIVSNGKLVIGVKAYVLYKHLSPLKTVYVYIDETGKSKIARSKAEEIVKSEVVSSEHENLNRPVFGNSLDSRSQITRGFAFGGGVLPFTDDELLKLRNIGDLGIRIIGFKPLTRLPLWTTSRPSYFLYPTEEEYVGSIRTFAALHQVLLQDQKYAVAWCKLTQRAHPMLCNIVAVDEQIELQAGREEQTQAPGLFLLRVPFSDDIRDPPGIIQNYLSASTPTVEKASLAISTLKMNLGFQHIRYPNPVVQWHYKVLQSKALEEELDISKPKDNSLPKYNSIASHSLEEVSHWKKRILKDLHKQRRPGRSRNQSNLDI